MVLGTHNVISGLLWTRDKHWHHDELSFHAEPWWKIVHAMSHRPSAMSTSHLTNRIHAICTQTESYVSRIQFKFTVGSIYFSLLRPISGVSQHRVFLAFLFVPSHQLALSLFLNRCFKRGIIGEYHMTFAGTLFRDAPPRHRQHSQESGRQNLLLHCLPS